MNSSILNLLESKHITLEEYIEEVNNIAPLSEGEEIEYVEQMSNGDELAKKKLFEGNLALAIYVANKYEGNGVSLMELICEGNKALMKILNTKDYFGHNGFKNRGVWWIRQAIARRVMGEKEDI